MFGAWLVSRVGLICVFLVVVSWLVWLVLIWWFLVGCALGDWFGYVVLESVVVVACFGLRCGAV